MALDLTQHPCFNSDVRHRTGRIHLPVAPQVQHPVQLLRPEVRLREREPSGRDQQRCSRQTRRSQYLDRALERVPYLKVVGIAGPGDPFANPEETMETPAPGSREISGDAALRGDQRVER